MTEKQWTNLIQAVRNQQCILLLGPNIATTRIADKKIPLNHLLANQLADKIQSNFPDLPILDKNHLAYVARLYEDCCLMRHPGQKPFKARLSLAEIVKDFYKKYESQSFPVYQYLAKLPFKYIINTTPDNLLLNAFFDAQKYLANQNFHFYNYKNPSDNKITIEEDSISEDAPLIYNLFGSINNPESLVITEKDQLEFIEAILQKEGTSTIPSSVAIHFSPNFSSYGHKTFLFLGFDFGQWHLRVILHLFNRYQAEAPFETFALQNPQNLNQLTRYFYRKNFEVEFVEMPPVAFIQEFENRYKNAHEEKPATAKLKLFLMYAQEDEGLRKELEKYLIPLKRNQLIEETWYEGKITAGSQRDQEIVQHLDQANIIILLVTEDFLSSDQIYDQQLQYALQRHINDEASIIPIIMKNCMWEESSFADLKTILPSTHSHPPVSSFKDRDQALKVIGKQLEMIIKIILKRRSAKTLIDNHV